ncbi:MAG: amidophosphoribosyltransferase [Acidobacteria bacterium]|nr:MAG: amidophosphoribosyltransferase [Acidobacteriota bacterium]REK03155.1 MAG: amidophosphoribosyltransferase [Acidobacteriota bacterium]REK15392.1 MAG: amidophosphoribosyltransferase [Acidobacteriota bacterium]REK42111.1 MAG: amidophosphoribosyltransferase [Acidobacteriota bacterium]
MEFDPDKFREECAVFGVFGHPEASTLTQLGLFALQHRGQEACGIVSSDGTDLNQIRRLGLVADNFPKETLDRLPGRSAIGHTRYSTAGKTSVREAQPFSVTCQHGQIAVCHNGNLPDAAARRKELERKGAIFSSTSDTETILHSIARCEARDAVEAIGKVLSDTEGAFSLLFLTPDALIAVRDPRGFRPLVLGRAGEAWAVGSETCAFDLIDAEYEREIAAGEMLVITKDGLKSMFPFEDKPGSVCTFEHVYFSRPDSIIFGRSVNQSRHLLGRHLAIEHPADADIVVPVPDSGVAAAIGYSAEANLSFRQGIIRNHYIGRTFIEPTQSIRSFGVRLKLNPIKDLIEGQRVVLVDDSIVRGTTSKKIVALVREAGATEVHMRISCPPTISPCYYGVNTPKKAELIAARMSVEEVREHIGADSLGYLSMEGMMKAIGIDRGSACAACWDGKYPTKINGGGR